MEKNKKMVKEVLPYVVIILVVVLIKIFVFTPVIVHGDSMLDTLHDHDIMILDKLSMRTKGIQRFDIVVVQVGDTKIIKRVIGLPGETIQYQNNKLYINGKFMEDSHGSDVTYDFDLVTIPDDMYYVLGDNRTDSVDSRILGVIPKKDILGKATFIIYPFQHFGSK